MKMMRQRLAAYGTVGMVVMLMAPADASRGSRWSEWSPPVNLGATINTPADEAAPAISRDGLTLYFTSNRPGVPPDAFGERDLYVVRRDRVDLPWGWPVNLGPAINTAGIDANPALSRNEHHLFFSRSAAGGPGDIWVSYRKSVHHDLGDGGWQPAVPLGPGVNTPEAEFTPAYFENRKRGLPQLYFTRPQPGSALADIYVAEAFGSAAPVTELNSTGSDARPSITADGLEIVFHSNRPGSAGNDLYSSVRKSVLEPWSAPQTLGTVVNSAASDFLGAITPDGTTLFFTSTRDGGFGATDIYVTTRERRRH